MKILWFCFLSILLSSVSYANSNFMSSRDLGPMFATSNIKLKNNQKNTRTIYGIYLRQLSYVLPGQPCSESTVIYPSSNNTSVGSIAMTVTLGPNKEAIIGPGILYNMIYASQYYAQVTIPSPLTGCSLPGCTWGTDTSVFNWCIQLGALGPVSVTPGFTTSNILPAAEIVANGNYNFNLINTFSELGPIFCNDQTLSCSTLSSQIQSF